MIYPRLKNQSNKLLCKMSEIKQEHINKIIQLVQRFTAADTSDLNRIRLFYHNIMNRAASLKIYDFDQYFSYLASNKKEIPYLIDNITIHTTQWFREIPHFNRLNDLIKKNFQGQKIRVLILACSTGQESYSIGLELELLRRNKVIEDYIIDSHDISPVAIDIAKQHLYHTSDLKSIPKKFTDLIRSENEYFIPHSNITARCTFTVSNVLNLEDEFEAYDIIFCRNMLFYLESHNLHKTIGKLYSHMKNNSYLFISHSEAIDIVKYPFQSLGNSIYGKDAITSTSSEGSRLNILLLEDEPDLVELFTDIISPFHDIDGTISLEEAQDKISKSDYDLILCDYSLGSGVTSEPIIQRFGPEKPLILMSGFASRETVDRLLDLGVDAFLPKPVDDNLLLQCIEVTSSSFYQNNAIHCNPDSQKNLILIGASTGGPQAINTVLSYLPENSPPIVIAQHLDKNFAHILLKSILQKTKLKAGLSVKGSQLQAGHVYITTDLGHIGVIQQNSSLKLDIFNQASEHNVHPSVDLLFASCQNLDCSKIIAVVLTGMGTDGALGLKKLKDNGALTIAQDEASSVVFGMPEAAVREKGAEMIMNPSEIGSYLAKICMAKAS